MSKIIRQRGFLGDPTKWIFKTKEGGDLYQRIAGGVILSGKKGGAAAVVAETPRLRPDEPQDLTLLGLRQCEDIEGAIMAALELRTDLRTQDYYTYTRDEAAMRYLDLYNSRAKDQRRPTLNVLPASYLESAPIYHLNILKQSLSPGRRILHLGEFDSRVKMALSEIGSETIHTAKFNDFPLVSSLAIAVTCLVENDYVFGEKRTGRALIHYDVLEHGIKKPSRKQAGQAKIHYDILGWK
jgi:hypothetical protein